ncbi:hypothetical protein SAMN04515620_14825 [Collimonas sp. OK607]|nr:hypothetical protein SAMN04515620_14825 [Collimonas sp. OK607]
MSAALEPEIPDTKYIAPISTYESPPRKCPSSDARNWTIAFAMDVISMIKPKNTNIGTANKIRCDIPSSIRPMTTIVGVDVARVR